MNFSIHPLATREAADAAAWYEQRRAGLGTAFMTVILEALRHIGEQPLAWPRWREDPTTRLFVVRRFPYVIAYRVTEDRIRVLAIAHDKRQQGYWRNR
ncbi:type II toxin-antitoxin system RelE/ParE family toxin [Nannocystaceae bacterium ST9]